MKIELFLQLPDKVLAQAFHMAFGDEYNSAWPEKAKAEVVRTIIPSDELYGCSVEKWQTVMAYLKKEVESTQTEYDKKRLYEKLNKQRSKGTWMISENHIDNNNYTYSALSMGSTLVADFMRHNFKQVGKNKFKNKEELHPCKESRANAEYVVLSVNNLHKLAEALHELLKSINPHSVPGGDYSRWDGNSISVKNMPSNESIIKAHVALKNIS